MSDSQVKIRQLTQSDVLAAAAMLKQMWVHHAEAEPELLDLNFLKNYDVEEYLSKFLGDSKNRVFIAELDGKIVGVVRAEIVPRRDMKYKFSKSLDIDEMVVSPDHRHRGIGSLLLEECFKFAREQDIKVCHAKIYSFSKEFSFFAEKNGLRNLYGDFYRFFID